MDNAQHFDFGQRSPSDRAAVLAAIASTPVARFRDSPELKETLLAIAELAWPAGRKEWQGTLKLSDLMKQIGKSLNATRERRNHLMRLGWIAIEEQAGRPDRVRINCERLFGVERSERSEGYATRSAESSRESRTHVETRRHGAGSDDHSPASTPTADAADARQQLQRLLERLLPLADAVDPHLAETLSRVVGSDWRGPVGDRTPPVGVTGGLQDPSSHKLEGSRRFPGARAFHAIPEGNGFKNEEEDLKLISSSSFQSSVDQRLEASRLRLEGSNRTALIPGMPLSALGSMAQPRMDESAYGHELWDRWSRMGLVQPAEKLAFFTLFWRLTQKAWRDKHRVEHSGGWLRRLVWNGDWCNVVGKADIAAFQAARAEATAKK